MTVPQCPRCKDIFAIQGRRPMVLPGCGHTICELCVSKEKLKVCFQCKSSWNGSKCVANFLLEEVMWGVEEKVSHDDNFISLITPPTVSLGKCPRCDKNSPTIYCKVEKSTFCDDCNVLIHSGNWSHHPRIKLDEAPLVSSDCSEHKEETLKFFCKECEKPVCRDCRDPLLGKHSRHTMLTLVQAVEQLNQQIVINVVEGLKLIESYVVDLEQAAQKSIDCANEETEIMKQRKEAAKLLSLHAAKEKKNQQDLANIFKADIKKMGSLLDRPMDYFTYVQELKTRFDKITQRYKTEAEELINRQKILNSASKYSSKG